MTKAVIAVIIALLVGNTNADASSAFGGLASMATGFLPPEMRGIAGAVANIALAKANMKKGVLEFIMDGTDYPWVCLCATPNQVKQLAAQGTKINPSQCPEDSKFGCRQPQDNMDAAPLPQPPPPSSSSKDKTI